jgi:hypothetical protein
VSGESTCIKPSGVGDKISSTGRTAAAKDLGQDFWVLGGGASGNAVLRNVKWAWRQLCLIDSGSADAPQGKK